MKNILRQSFPSEYFNKPKIIMYENYIEIYNYGNILDISNEIVVINKYIIEGENIRVISLDKSTMKITGHILSIRRRYNE
ncbi:hypothetical protein RI065_09315 [Mycoplasmatota bacterium zrk1]